MANQLLIDIFSDDVHDAGSKARNDVANILNNNGFNEVVMFNRSDNSLKRIIQMIRANVKIGKNINNGDLIVMQYPYKATVMKAFISRINGIKKRKQIKLIILLHDVLYLREIYSTEKERNLLKRTEVSIFNSADTIIVHNHIMKEELLQNGVNKPMVELELFDYIYEGHSITKNNDDKTHIIFAGNLSEEKSGFIYNNAELKNCILELYGSNINIKRCAHNYHGSFPPEELIEKMQGDYGLIWDGPSIDGCCGNYGEYMRYNNPHKLSLYIAAELPVIVWKESAIADFVRNNHIGVAVSSLREVDELPNKNSDEYRIMCYNIKSMAQRVRNGEYLMDCLETIYGI